MDNVLNIASYIARRYEAVFGQVISEMKLHKLLYFTQRECLIRKGNLMFPDEFYAWKYGPVMPVIRSWYANGMPVCRLSKKSEQYYSDVFDFVFEHYAPRDAWSLSRLTHEELSWKVARHGLKSDQNGNVPISNEDIFKDALRAKRRRFIIDRFNRIETL